MTIPRAFDGNWQPGGRSALQIAMPTASLNHETLPMTCRFTGVMAWNGALVCRRTCFICRYRRRRPRRAKVLTGLTKTEARERPHVWPTTDLRCERLSAAKSA
jgi:hypothetical protein